jgi:type IV secretion system protein VirB3
MERIDENTLYLAATRPALFAGVPVAVAGIILMSAGLVIVVGQNPLYELIMLPLWSGARMLVSRDYNAVHVVWLFLLSAGRSLEGPDWGGASVSPHPIKVAARGRGMI